MGYVTVVMMMNFGWRWKCWPQLGGESDKENADGHEMEVDRDDDDNSDADTLTGESEGSTPRATPVNPRWPLCLVFAACCRMWSVGKSSQTAVCLFVCWLLNVPATCKFISGTDLLRQLYVLPHWDRSCRPNFPSHPVTVYWHWADQSQRWPCNARRLAG